MENNKKIELDFEEYNKLITENISLKKEMEYINKPIENTITVSSNIPPTVEEPIKEKKGFFNE